MTLFGIALFITLSFLCVYGLPQERRSSATVIMFFIMVFAHHVVSIINTHFIILPGADYDAHYFHLNALRSIENNTRLTFTVGTGVYEWLIFSLYKLFGASKLLAQSLNVLVAVVTSVVVCRISSIVDEKISYTVVLGCLTISPAILFFTSITFREVFQLFGFVLGCYCFFKAIRGKSLLWLVFSFVSLLIMGAFHHVLLVLSVLISVVSFIVYALVAINKSRREKTIFFLTGIAVLACGVLIVFIFPASNGNDYLEMLRHSGSVKNMIEQYRQAVDSSNPRSSYGFIVDTSTTLQITLGLARSYLYYLLGFWPSSSTSWVDLIPLVGGLIRFLGIGCCIYIILTKRINIYHAVLIVIFIGMSFTWSMGTTNFGQAFRHNVLTDWIIVIWISTVIFPQRYKRLPG